MLYPSVSHKIFRIFICRLFSPDEAGWLEADYSVDCSSKEYKQLRKMALVLVVAIPIGLPAFFASLLYKRRKRLLEFKELTVGAVSQTDRRDQQGLEANTSHRDWPWKEAARGFAQAVPPWISASKPSSIDHIAQRGVSTSFLLHRVDNCLLLPTPRRHLRPALPDV